MGVLLLTESVHGNTSLVGAAIGDGLRAAGHAVTVRTASEMLASTADGARNASVRDLDPTGAGGHPDASPASGDGDESVRGFELVVVGAPTHNWGLPTPESRAKAGVAGPGVAEWFDSLDSLKGVRVAAFDTRRPGRFSGSAAKRIVRRARALGASVSGSEGFIVTGTPAVLGDGELERARAWGETLA